MAKSTPPPFDPHWAKAKTVCMEDIRMAKALGMSPKALLKNNPNPAQRWKAPVKHWIRELYDRRFGQDRKAALNNERSRPAPNIAKTNPTSQDDESIPF